MPFGLGSVVLVRRMFADEMSDGDEYRPLLMTKKIRTFDGYCSIQKERHLADLQIERPVYKQEQLNLASYYEKPTTSCRKIVSNYVRSCSPITCCLNSIPVLKWMPYYRWNRDLLGDLLSGITVAIMHIPQGIAYGLLGNVDPVVGIYMAFFPVLVYFFLGTSKHVSMGTFAIVCLMTGKVVSKYTPDDPGAFNTTSATDIDPGIAMTYTPIQVATTVTFTVAVMQMAMYLLRLGVVTTLLSETLVNGFTCASAFHVVASQLKDLLGVSVPKRRGFFSFVYAIYDAIMALPNANRTAISISLVAVVIMVLNNEIFKPWLSKRTKIPFPIELIAVVMGTMLCYLLDFHNKYGISIVGEIPTGLPEPALPQFSLIPSMLLDCFVITVISYTITISMAFIFAQKLHYEVNPNQELFALSCSNVLGSLFSCMPITASLSRSMIQQTVGGVTQIASVVSCLILLVVLLWIGPFFETLPRCVLASIIVVALKGMLMQCKSLKRYWQLSIWDAIIWLVTFLTTVLVSIDIGLAAGICISLINIFIKGQVPYTCLLGVVPNTDLYLDCKRYKGVQEIEGLKIFHYCGALNFASKAAFKTHLFRRVGFDPTQVLIKRNQMETRGTFTDEEDIPTRCIIVDFSALTYIDPAGADLLRLIARDYEQLDIEFYVTCCSGPVYEMLKKCDKLETLVSKLTIFPTIHDAVLYARVNILRGKHT